MAPPNLPSRCQTIQANQPPPNGVQGACHILQASDRMRNAASRIKEATSALQFELLQQLEALDNDRDTIRTRLTADIKRLTAENDTQAAEIKTQAAKIKTLAANKETLEADLYDENMSNEKTEQDLKKAEQALKEERTRNYANRNAIQKMREIMANLR